MRNSVLDSHAVLAFLFQERGHEKVIDLFEKAVQANQVILIAAPNWAELRSVVERKVGVARWDEARQKLLGLPLEIVSADQALSELAGELKAVKKMSLADCFAAALAKTKKADLYTGDPEFKAMEKELKIIWV